MKTDLEIQMDDYTTSFCILLYADALFAEVDEEPWVFLYKYPDLLSAEEGMLRHKQRNKGEYAYKIMQFDIKAQTRQRG